MIYQKIKHYITVFKTLCENKKLKKKQFLDFWIFFGFFNIYFFIIENQYIF